MKIALPILALFCCTANAADPPEITLKDVPVWDSRNYKVAAFINSAAKFQAIGKDKAQKVLLELADLLKPRERHEARLRAEGLTGDRLEIAVAEELFREREQRQGLFILCRMLFTAKPKAEFRRPMIGLPACVGETDFADSPLEPIEISDGVPFLVVWGYALGGSPEPASWYVDYCVKNCDWNPVQFKPKTTEEQQKALEKLLASPKLKGINATDKKFLASQIDRPDLVVADFDGDTYGDGWTTTGTAFGKGPAKGTLPNQMPVTGYLGKGLVNSYLGGDDSTGTLTSPALKVERKYINFLVGGGKYPGKTCVNLLVGGKIVRTATGPNDKPGGSERLDWHSWDVAEFEGKEAVFQIVDDQKGGWGHINVDHIVQSDAKRQAESVQQAFAIEKRYLHLPVKNGAAVRRMRFLVDKESVREFDIELADGEAPDFWVFADVSAFKGKTLTIETVTTTGHKALDAIKQADDVPDAEKLYREKHRPLFHFTSRRGWLNDPNGLVFVPDRENNPWGQNGEWHLFYQHNPFGREWGNMHWGHAVSSDLFHWKELGEALYPKKYGDWAFSGSAVADNGNTSGWGMKDKPPLVLAYTSTGRGECIAYSTDKGRTWTEYDKNPVVKHSGRDPKLVWYEKGKHWVMAVYDEFGKKQWIAFYTSPDLKTWTFASRVEGFFECPDLFELPVCGHGFGERLAKWVLYAADGKYVVGEFDGKTFKPDHTGKKQLWYGNFYAAQTFDNSPGRRPQDLPFDAKRIQIGWAQGATFPGMPFNQQMTVPVHLMLWKGQDPVDPDEIRLTANPVEQLWGLRERPPAFDLQGGQRQVVAKPTTLADRVDAFDATLSIELGQAKGFTLDLRGTKLVYVGTKHTPSCKNVTAPAKPHNDVVILRILVDRGSVEVFADESRVAMSVAAIPDEKNRALGLTPHDGEVTVRSATVYRLKSAWEK